ncbi:hypothetical protein HAX54_014887 [Datura stramonium]|uniref:Uncharacterized protein n=1 Tax=Datura stramonium TaxID=4076 RepID=A0ABS8Y664_DATST|nr:hypothetical protein [Datura stramonium]
MSNSPEISQSQPSHDQIPPTVPLTGLPSSIEGELVQSVTPSGGSPDSSMRTFGVTTLLKLSHLHLFLRPSLVRLSLTLIWLIVVNLQPTVSLSDSRSSDDSVPLVELRKGARKRLLFHSSQVTASKIPCVTGPTSRTRAHRMMVEEPLAKPQSSTANQPKLRVLSFLWDDL